MAAGIDRAERLKAVDPADAAGLVLVKLLIDVGRARGELLSAGLFVRTHAVHFLVTAVRGLMPPATATGDGLDPLRRLERDHPAVAGRIADAVEAPVEEAARGLFDVARTALPWQPPHGSVIGGSPLSSRETTIDRPPCAEPRTRPVCTAPIS